MLSVNKALCSVLSEGDVIVAVDSNYYRPTEVHTLLGDSSLAKEELGWTSRTSINEMIREMVEHDLDHAKRIAELRRQGYEVNMPRE